MVHSYIRPHFSDKHVIPTAGLAVRKTLGARQHFSSISDFKSLISFEFLVGNYTRQVVCSFANLKMSSRGFLGGEEAGDRVLSR